MKDLAKLCGRFCLVFNCSDGVDVLTMACFFKGLMQVCRPHIRTRHNDGKSCESEREGLARGGRKLSMKERQTKTQTSVSYV